MEELAATGDSAAGGFSLLCGRYEGVDQRVTDHLVDGELSIGDYVLGGGEVPALAVIEAVARLDSRGHGQRGLGARRELHVRACSSTRSTPGRRCSGVGAVPEVLLSGDHGRIARWRRAMALRRTLELRPDLVGGAGRPGRRRTGACSRSSSDEPLATAGRSTPVVRRCPGRGYPGVLGRLCTARPPRRCGGPGGAARAARSWTCEGTRVMNPTDIVDRENLRDDVPDFRPGDTLKVHVRVVEGSRERTQVFQGAVIRRQGTGARETFTVRKLSFGVGVERTFPVHSPILAKIEVVTRGDVRRAKLYYLRGRVGKAAKIKEKRAART